VKIDEDGRLFHACAGLALTPEMVTELERDQPPPNFNYDIETEMAFELESMPGAQRTIYLDFDGHITRNTFWNNADRPEIIHPPMDLDGTPNEFTEREKRAIINIWKQVVEDFSPYKVNVTTKEPPLSKLLKSSNDDQEFGIRVVIGGNGRNFLNASYGGIAYVGSFSWNSDTPTFAFSDNLGRNPKFIAEVISHEVGHTAGLWHHGRTDGATYHSGDGEWAPIMGVAYSARVGQWSRGEYPLANNKADDIQVMSQYMPFKTNVEEKPFHNPEIGKPFYGTIHRPNEVDSFFLELEGGQITVRVELPPVYPNTDLCMNLKDSEGNVISTHKFHPQPFKTLLVKEGRYVLELFGSTFPGAGPSAYGSVGEYKLTVTQDSVQSKIMSARINEDFDKLEVVDIAVHPPNPSLEFKYQWQIATHNAPSNFYNLDNSDRRTLAVSGQDMLGKYVRVIITPVTGLNNDQSFIAGPVKLVSPATTEIGVNDYLEFSSNLSMGKNTLEARPLIVNEISQGHRFGENPEWIEFLTLKEVDLRGFQIRTKNHSVLNFKNTEWWSSIPEGTLIVVYNGLEKDPLIGVDKFLPRSERLIVASSSDPFLFDGEWSNLRAPQSRLSVDAGFENVDKSFYGKAIVKIDNVAWILDDALIGADERDMKEGQKSLRLRNGSIETQYYLGGGISQVSFLHARSNFSGDRTGTPPSFQVSYSPRTQPDIWIPVGEPKIVSTDSLVMFTATVNYDGEYKMRISKVSGTPDKRWNIDNLKITESATLNFIEIRDNDSRVVLRKTFGYTEEAPRNGFLLPATTESFVSDNPLLVNEETSWLDLLWSKNNFSITPGKPNNPLNSALVTRLSSSSYGQMPLYILKNAPQGLHVNSETGTIYGSVSRGGFYRLKISATNGLDYKEESIPLLVKHTFSEAFADKPEIKDDPTGDHSGNGVANIVEFALGGTFNIETELRTVADLEAWGDSSNSKSHPNELGSFSVSAQSQLALVIKYTRNKAARGVRIVPQWSEDLMEWSEEGITTVVTGDSGDLESVMSWVSSDREGRPLTSMFMRVSVVQ
jgi:hypothetical protein